MSEHTDGRFVSMPTQELAADTLRRAGELHTVTDRLWETLPLAVLASVPAAAVLAVAFVNGLEPLVDWWLLALTGIAAVTAFAWGARPWFKARAASRAFTAEMKARGDELRRRTDADRRRK